MKSLFYDYFICYDEFIFYEGFMFLHRVHELYMFYYTKDGFLQHKTLPFAAQKATF